MPSDKKSLKKFFFLFLKKPKTKLINLIKGQLHYIQYLHFLPASPILCDLSFFLQFLKAHSICGTWENQGKKIISSID